MFVDAVSVHVLVQCNLLNLVNSERGCWYLFLLMGLLLASHVIEKLGVFADIKGEPHHFEFICEYHDAGFKEAHYVAPFQD